MIDAGLAALLGGIVGGLAGIGGQIFASFLVRSREREARNQDRLERTYQQVMTEVNRHALTVSRVEPDFWFGPAAPEPPAPVTEEELLRLESLIGLHGSDAIRAEMLVLQRYEREFGAAVGLYRTYRGSFPGRPTPDEMNKSFDDYRAARQRVLDEAKKIEELAREELRGGPWWRP